MLLVIVWPVVVFKRTEAREEIITALTNANPLMAVVTPAFGVCGWIGSVRFRRFPDGAAQSA